VSGEKRDGRRVGWKREGRRGRGRSDEVELDEEREGERREGCCRFEERYTKVRIRTDARARYGKVTDFGSELGSRAGEIDRLSRRRCDGRRK